MPWNTIVNAVYRNEWTLIEHAVPFHHDDANDAADAMANEIAQRLRAGDASCVRETLHWLLHQPYINRERFSEWVALDALKGDSALHTTTYIQVRPYCRKSHMQEIANHITECNSPKNSWGCTTQ